MFTPEQRARLRADLLEYAAGDRRISSAAITGSAAAGREDEWSDIDLAFGVGDAAKLPNVLSDWTAHMYDRHQALHHLDIRSGAWIYRVFLLPSTLQILGELLLPRSNPWCIMAGRDPAAAVAEENSDLFDGHTCLQQLNAEGISESVAEAVLNASHLK